MAEALRRRLIAATIGAAHRRRWGRAGTAPRRLQRGLDHRRTGSHRAGAPVRRAQRRRRLRDDLRLYAQELLALRVRVREVLLLLRVRMRMREVLLCVRVMHLQRALWTWRCAAHAPYAVPRRRVLELRVEVDVVDLRLRRRVQVVRRVLRVRRLVLVPVRLHPRHDVHNVRRRVRREVRQLHLLFVLDLRLLLDDAHLWHPRRLFHAELILIHIPHVAVRRARLVTQTLNVAERVIGHLARLPKRALRAHRRTRRVLHPAHHHLVEEHVPELLRQRGEVRRRDRADVCGPRVLHERRRAARGQRRPRRGARRHEAVEVLVRHDSDRRRGIRRRREARRRVRRGRQHVCRGDQCDIHDRALLLQQ